MHRTTLATVRREPTWLAEYNAKKATVVVTPCRGCKPNNKTKLT